MGSGGDPRPALDRRADRRQPGAHAGAAGRRGIHDAQLHGDVPLRPGRRHVTPADDADGAVVSQVPQRRRSGTPSSSGSTSGWPRIGAFESAATATSNLPLGGGRGIQLTIDGRTKPDERLPIVTLLSVGPRYFDTHRHPGSCAAGLFTETDGTPGAGQCDRQSAVRRTCSSPGKIRLAGRIRLSDEVPTNIVGRPLPPLTIVGVTTPNVRAARTSDGQYLRARSGGVHPARRQHAAGPRHHAARPDAVRSGASDAAAARGDAGARSGHAAVQHPDDGSEPGAAALAVAGVRHDVRDLRGHRARPVGGRACTPSRPTESRSARRRSASAWRSAPSRSRCGG